MKKILALIVLLTSCTIYAQTKFEKGYFITTEGNKVECLIKNEDWYNIPSEINYKLDENSTLNTISNNTLKMVYIKDKLLLERHNVLIDKYSKKLNELTNTRITNYKEESLLLKVIVDGKARLLKYVDKGVQHFYYELNSEIKPLEYKLYKTSKGTLGKNLNYQKTLREKFSCPKTKLKTASKYTEIALTKFFKQYNNCNGEDNSVYSYSKLAKGAKINIRAKISIGFSNSENPFNTLSRFNFKNKTTYKIGAEIEYVLPFFNNKWSGFVEPTYQSYSDKTESITQAGDFSYSIDYSSIELPFGVRYYSFLNDENKIFFNGGFNLDWVLNDKISFANEPSTTITINTTTNYFIGVGYELNNKFSLEFRYNTPRDLSRFSGLPSETKFNNYSLKLGYNFL
ncbi:outer membrane beta-barrel protein [Tenacibaculum sp. MEBiC06402]|uniref:outer membrane beta-barrel protein n=1 Tax=unclassified Tenacibaculum TaxID=2635139 RepID=UPI003B9B97FE